jgi:hypothetical protein
MVLMDDGSDYLVAAFCVAAAATVADGAGAGGAAPGMWPPFSATHCANRAGEVASTAIGMKRARAAQLEHYRNRRRAVDLGPGFVQLAGVGVLLDPERRHSETVDDVVGGRDELHHLSCRNDEAVVDREERRPIGVGTGALVGLASRVVRFL